MLWAKRRTAIGIVMVMGGALLPVHAAKIAPGSSRWKVQIGEDSGAARVPLFVLGRSVSQLGAIPRPAGIDLTSPRQPGAEMRRFAVSGVLKQWRLEADGDYSLAIEGTDGATVLAKIPRPQFIPGNNAWHREISVARFRFQDRLKLKEVESTDGVAHASNAQLRVVGVGFFAGDKQRGAAPNGLELHPVLSLVWLP